MRSATSGIIDGTNVSPDQGLFSGNVDNLNISQTGGLVESDGATEHDLNDTIYEISDGSMILDSLHIDIGSSFTISGGAVEIGSAPGNTRDMIQRSSFTITNGILDVSNDFGAVDSSFSNFEGGVTDMLGNAMIGSDPTGTFNFSNDAVLSVGGTLGDPDSVGTRMVNFGLGTGSVTTGTLESTNMSMDWLSGSVFSLTASAITGAASSYSGLSDAGILTIDGAQIGNFTDNFAVSGDTLSLVPEPSNYPLLFGGLALGLAMIRRRRG